MTDILLSAGPRSGVTLTVGKPWPRTFLKVDGGDGEVHTYIVDNPAGPAPYTATWQDPASAESGDDVFGTDTTGPTGLPGTQGMPGPPGAKGDEGAGLNPLGLWSSIVTYSRLDMVTDGNGSSFVSLSDLNLNHLPADATWWLQVAARGPQGIQGLKGDTGNTGATGPPMTILDEGVVRAIRSKLNFIGANVAVTDDAAGDKLDVTISGTSGGVTALDNLVSGQKIAWEDTGADFAEIYGVHTPAGGMSGKLTFTFDAGPDWVKLRPSSEIFPNYAAGRWECSFGADYPVASPVGTDTARSGDLRYVAKFGGAVGDHGFVLQVAGSVNPSDGLVFYWTQNNNQAQTFIADITASSGATLNSQSVPAVNPATQRPWLELKRVGDVVTMNGYATDPDVAVSGSFPTPIATAQWTLSGAAKTKWGAGTSVRAGFDISRGGQGGNGYVEEIRTASFGASATNELWVAITSAADGTRRAYRLLADGGVGDFVGPAGAAGVAGLTWRGAWAAATAYAVNDAVTDSGSSYRRKVAGTTATAPGSDATNWDVIAAKGATGATGGGATQLVNETFADLSAYTVESGAFEIASGRARVVAGQTLQQVIYRTAPIAATDLYCVMKTYPAAAVSDGETSLILKRLSNGNRIECSARYSGGVLLELWQFDAGTGVSKAVVTLTSSASSPAMFVAGEPHWVVGRVIGNMQVVEYWLTDPIAGGAPFGSLSRRMAGADAAKFGAGVSGGVGWRCYFGTAGQDHGMTWDDHRVYSV